MRMLLLVGLGMHKLVWEALKRNGMPSQADSKAGEKPLTRLIKFFKIAALAGIVGQTLFLPDFPPITSKPEPLRVGGLLLYVVGLATAIIGRIQLGKNWANLEDYQVLPDQSLVTTGIYGHIRHPIYTGDILLLLGLEFALNSWLILGVIPLVVVIKQHAMAEEAVLSGSFPNYEAYRQRTKMFIPLVW